jgi:membrane protease YdiL (CAAX protease family)
VPSPLPRWLAISEVLLVSGIPTQVLVASVLVLLVGFDYPASGPVPLSFLATLSLVDAALVITLVAVFLRLAGEKPGAVFVGKRPWWPDALRGLLFVPLVVLLVAGLVLGIRTIAPWTRTVETNPLEAYLNSPGQAAVLLVVAVFAGGVREEFQRAFVLHRFGQYLGGMRVGLVFFTIVFGALHIDQGLDVAIAVGGLGLWWGLVYMRHRSFVLPMTNHAAFNAIQVLQAFLVRAAG